MWFSKNFCLKDCSLPCRVEFKDSPKYLGQANSMAQVCQTLGGTIGLGVAEPVFTSQLNKFIPRFASNVPAVILKEAPTAIYVDLNPEQIASAIKVYVESLRIVYLVGVPIGEYLLINIPGSDMYT
jgi:hypothetical protein